MKRLILILVFTLPLYAGRSFNGTTDSASASGNGTAIDLAGATVITMGGWVYMPSIPGSEAQPFGKGSNVNGTEQYYVNVSQPGHASDFGCHFFQTTPLNHNSDVYAGITALSNTWYQITCTWNAGTSSTKIYVNGVFKAQVSNASGVILTPGVGNPNWCFGGYPNTGTPGTCGSHISYAGRVAEVFLLSGTELSASQIGQLSHVCPLKLGIPFVGYWPLTGASGVTIEPELSGHKLSATLTGTTAANHPPCTP